MPTCKFWMDWIKTDLVSWKIFLNYIQKIETYQVLGYKWAMCWSKIQSCLRLHKMVMLSQNVIFGDQKIWNCDDPFPRTRLANSTSRTRLAPKLILQIIENLIWFIFHDQIIINKFRFLSYVPDLIILWPKDSIVQTFPI